VIFRSCKTRRIVARLDARERDAWRQCRVNLGRATFPSRSIPTLTSLSRREQIRESGHRGLVSDEASALRVPMCRVRAISWLSPGKEAVISLTVTRKGEQTDGRTREREVRTPRRGCEGIQFPSSRGWRAAHTLPFGAVTPRELWSPNEWLGRTKRRITYFFFLFFSRVCSFPGCL